MSDWPSTLITPSGGVIHSMRSPASAAYGISRAAGGSAITSAAWTTANRAIYIPFAVETTVTAYQMAVVNGSVLNLNLDVGLYDVNGVRLVSIGSGTAQTGASVIQKIDIADTVLTPGIYFMAMSTNSTTATYLGSVVQTTPQDYFRLNGIQEQTSAFALPATATFANPATTTTSIPSIAVALRSVI